ncbi:hypothetical protein DIPPA_26497 [Diplonema papillatum]|nr:hypothetical protein DIPPA_26497 [Diplonema papillatum]
MGPNSTPDGHPHCEKLQPGGDAAAGASDAGLPVAACRLPLEQQPARPLLGAAAAAGGGGADHDRHRRRRRKSGGPGICAAGGHRAAALRDERQQEEAVLLLPPAGRTPPLLTCQSMAQPAPGQLDAVQELMKARAQLDLQGTAREAVEATRNLMYVEWKGFPVVDARPSHVMRGCRRSLFKKRSRGGVKGKPCDGCSGLKQDEFDLLPVLQAHRASIEERRDSQRRSSDNDPPQQSSPSANAALVSVTMSSTMASTMATTAAAAAAAAASAAAAHTTAIRHRSFPWKGTSTPRLPCEALDPALTADFRTKQPGDTPPDSARPFGRRLTTFSEMKRSRLFKRKTRRKGRKDVLVEDTMTVQAVRKASVVSEWVTTKGVRLLENEYHGVYAAARARPSWPSAAAITRRLCQNELRAAQARLADKGSLQPSCASCALPSAKAHADCSAPRKQAVAGEATAAGPAGRQATDRDEDPPQRAPAADVVNPQARFPPRRSTLDGVRQQRRGQPAPQSNNPDTSCGPCSSSSSSGTSSSGSGGDSAHGGPPRRWRADTLQLPPVVGRARRAPPRPAPRRAAAAAAAAAQPQQESLPRLRGPDPESPPATPSPRCEPAVPEAAKYPRLMEALAEAATSMPCIYDA